MARLLEPYEKFREEFPELAAAYDSLGEAGPEKGPLDLKARELIKLGIAISTRQKGATRSNTRRALEAYRSLRPSGGARSGLNSQLLGEMTQLLSRQICLLRCGALLVL